MRRSSVPGAFRSAKHRAGMTKMGVAIPTLRHAYATPLLDAGVNPCLLPRDLGPPQRATTRLALQLTHTGHEDASERLPTRMHGFLP